MKFKVKRSIKHHETRLIVTLGKKDELDFAHAELLHGGAFQAFLPFDFMKKKNGYRFTYRADGYISLEALKRRTLTSEQFKIVMNSFLTLLKICEENGFLLQRVAFAPDRVFYNKTYSELRFAYVPVKSYTSGKESFQTCIAYLCEDLKLESGFDANRAMKIYSFVNTSPITSSIDFERCLRNVELLDARPEQLNVKNGPKPERDDVLPSSHSAYAWNFMETKEFSSDDPVSPVGDTSDFSDDPPIAPQPVKPIPQRPMSNETVCYANAGMSAVGGMKGAVSQSGAFLLRRCSTGESWLLEPGTYEIGRHPDCSIILHDASRVSRKHASVVVKDGRLLLRDAGSRNGTYAKGKKLRKSETVALDSGSFFVIGGERFDVVKQEGNLNASLR